MIHTLSGRLATLALVAIAAACAAPAQRFEPAARMAPAARGPMWKDTGTPAIAHEREIRFYADEKGVLWDDRGRKQETR